MVADASTKVSSITVYFKFDTSVLGNDSYLTNTIVGLELEYPDGHTRSYFDTTTDFF